MHQQISVFLSDDSGATAVEYGLLVSFIGTAVLGTIPLVGTSIADIFEIILAKLQTVV